VFEQRRLLGNLLLAPSDCPSPGPAKARRLDPRWKILYLLGMTAGALAVPRSARPVVVPALLLLQVAFLFALRVPVRDLVRMAARLRTPFLILATCYLLLPAPAGDRVVPLPLGLFDWPLGLNLTGLGTAAVMCGQVLTVVLASAVVRRSGSENDLVDGLRKLRCPRLLTYSIDNTLALLGGLDRPGMGGGKGDGGGRGRGRDGQAGPEPASEHAGPGFLAIVRRLARGDLGSLVNAIRSGIDRATERSCEAIGAADRSDRRLVHDVTIVSGIALFMMSLKLFKVLPGVPFAPGHKTLVLIPLYILAAQLTYSRFGATAAGTVMGIIGQFQGSGQYGVLSVLKHVLPGLATDLLWPLFRRLPRRVWVYSILGILLALCRLATEFFLALVLEARWEVYLFLTWRVVTSLLAGALSGGVTYLLLPAFRSLEPEPGPAPTLHPGRREPGGQAERTAPAGAPLESSPGAS
jgi:hypothetical protein